MFRIDRPGWLLEPRGNMRPRGMAASAGVVRKDTDRATEPGLQAPWQFCWLAEIQEWKGTDAHEAKHLRQKGAVP